VYLISFVILVIAHNGDEPPKEFIVIHVGPVRILFAYI